MKVLKIILIVLIFVCLFVGFLFVLGNKMFVSKKRNSPDTLYRKQLKIKLIGYVLLMLSMACAVFQSLITI